MSETRTDRDAVIRFSQFIIRKESEALAKDCQSGLIETVLFNKNNAGLEVLEIENEINSQMGLKDFPIYIINTSLKDCIVKGEIYEQSGKYFLESETFEEIEKIVAYREKTIAHFESTLKTRVRQETGGTSNSEKLADLALETVYKFLASWFSSESSFVANMLQTRKQITIPDVPMNILTESLKQIEDSGQREIIKKSIIEAFQALESSSGKILYEILQNYIHLELLNIDPECRHLQQVAFSHKTLILDTNILMALFLEAHPSHEGITETISIAKDLGVNLVMTKRTEQEWLRALERAGEEFQSIKGQRSSLLPNLRNVFIRSFLKKQAADSALTWQGYYLQMRQIKAFASEKGIDYWYKKETDLDKLLYKEYFEPLWGRVYACAEWRGHTKSKEVSEHDAYHLLLVRKLREVEVSDALGPSCWFFTLDTTLYCADEGLNQFMKAPFDPPSSFIADMWIPIIAPFLGPQVPESRLADAFATLMKTHFATIVPALSGSAVLDVLGNWLPYKTLSDKEIEAILGDALVVRYYEELRTARIKNPRKVEEMNTKLHQKVDEKVYEIFDSKISEANREKTKAQSLALEKEEQLLFERKQLLFERKQLLFEKQQRRLILRACGVLGIIFAVVGLIFLTLSYLAVGVVLIVAGIIFTALALGFSRIRGKIGPIEVEAQQ